MACGMFVIIKKCGRRASNVTVIIVAVQTWLSYEEHYAQPLSLVWDIIGLGPQRRPRVKLQPSSYLSRVTLEFSWAEAGLMRNGGVDWVEAVAAHAERVESLGLQGVQTNENTESGNETISTSELRGLPAETEDKQEGLQPSLRLHSGGLLVVREAFLSLDFWCRRGWLGRIVKHGTDYAAFFNDMPGPQT